MGQNPDSAQNPPNPKLSETQNELIKKKQGGKWTPERRAAAALRASRQKPWLHATGPKTAEGKRRSRYNAFKHGLNSRSTKEIRSLFRRYSKWLSALNALITAEKRRRRYISSQKSAINPCTRPSKPPITTPTINLARATALCAGFLSERRKSCPSTKPCLSHGRILAMRR